MRRLDRHAHRHVGARQHLARPQDLGLALDVGARDAERQAVALAALVERRHQPRTARRAAAHGGLQAEAPVIAAQARRPDLDDVHGRVPHQRAVGEEPQIAVASRERRSPSGLARLVGEAPGGRVAVLARHAVEVGEPLDRLPEVGLLRRDDLAGEGRHMDEGFGGKQHCRTGRGDMQGTGAASAGPARNRAEPPIADKATGRSMWAKGDHTGRRRHDCCGSEARGRRRPRRQGRHHRRRGCRRRRHRQRPGGGDPAGQGRHARAGGRPRGRAGRAHRGHDRRGGRHGGRPSGRPHGRAPSQGDGGAPRSTASAGSISSTTMSASAAAARWWRRRPRPGGGSCRSTSSRCSWPPSTPSPR